MFAQAREETRARVPTWKGQSQVSIWKKGSVYIVALNTWEDAHTKQEFPRAYSMWTDISEGSATVLHFETLISVYIRVSQLSLAPRGYACNSVWTQEMLCNKSDKTLEKTAHRAWKSPSL